MKKHIKKVLVFVLGIFISINFFGQEIILDVHKTNNEKLILKKKNKNYILEKVSLRDSTKIDTLFNKKLSNILDCYLGKSSLAFIFYGDVYEVKVFKSDTLNQTWNSFNTFRINVSDAFYPYETIQFLSENVILRDEASTNGKQKVFYFIKEDEMERYVIDSNFLHVSMERSMRETKRKLLEYQKQKKEQQEK